MENSQVLSHTIHLLEMWNDKHTYFTKFTNFMQNYFNLRALSRKRSCVNMILQVMLFESKSWSQNISRCDISPYQHRKQQELKLSLHHSYYWNFISSFAIYFYSKTYRIYLEQDEGRQTARPRRKYVFGLDMFSSLLLLWTLFPRFLRQH